VVPDTVLGLLLFVGAIGPGYVWVRVAEVRRPQQQRSAILEAAELAFVGLLCTGLAALVVLAVADGWDALGVDLESLAADGGEYLLTEPVRGVGLVLAILALGFLASLTAAWIHHTEPATILPGYSVWDRLFRVDDASVRVYAAVELRDRRRFSGYVYVWDVGTSEEDRELALQAPIMMQAPGGDAVELGDPYHFLSVRREDVRWVAVSQDPSPFEASV
jgi:hypothetical protein